MSRLNRVPESFKWSCRIPSRKSPAPQIRHACSPCARNAIWYRRGAPEGTRALPLLALEAPNALAKARANETGCARRKRALLEWRRAARDAGNRIKKRRFAPQFSFDYAALASPISGREPTARNLTKDTMGYQEAKAAPDYVTLICVK